MSRSRTLPRGGSIALSTLLLATACGGSDAADPSLPTSETPVDPAPDGTDPLFSEVTSDSGVVPPSAGTADLEDDPRPDTTGDTTGDTVPVDAASTTVTAADDPGQSSVTTVEGGSVSTAPTTDAGSTSTVAEQPSSTSAPVAGSSGPNPFADIEEVIDAGSVDDVPFCQAYANLFNTFLGVAFASAFAETGVDDGPDEPVPPESLELLAYPRLVDDVRIIVDEAPSFVSGFFDPLSVRVDASSGLLRNAGFGDDVISTLAAADRLGQIDVGGIFADGIDPRLVTATSALVDRFGTFDEFSESMGGSTPAADQAEADAFFESECPMLFVAFDDV